MSSPGSIRLKNTRVVSVTQCTYRTKTLDQTMKLHYHRRRDIQFESVCCSESDYLSRDLLIPKVD